MSKIAFLFPGQGSQFLGMGKDFFYKYDFVSDIFDIASKIARKNIPGLCFLGPMGALRKTVNLQIAITAVNLACLSVIEKEGCRCDFAIGHSLGEYSALKAAKILSLSDTFKSVIVRGILMGKEAEKQEGVMYAIIGLGIDVLRKIINKKESKGIVSIANYNTKNQIVVSGQINSVKEVIFKSKLNGAMVIPLKVEGAWHSELMDEAKSSFMSFLNTIEINKPVCKIIHNVNCGVATNASEIRNLLVNQISSPVLWYDSICKLLSEGVNIFIEIGPGRVLTGLLKKIISNNYACKIYSIFDKSTLDFFLNDNS